MQMIGESFDLKSTNQLFLDCIFKVSLLATLGKSQHASSVYRTC